MEIKQFAPELAQIGLSEDQALVYTTLLERNTLPASKVALFSNKPRTFVYKILDELISLGLVVKVDKVDAVSRFTAEHPLKLRELIDNQRTQVEKNKRTLDGMLSSLISEFTARSGKPGIRVLSGVAGIEELYEDILNEQSPILLIRSYKDTLHGELESIVAKQIDAQVKAGITTQAITPFTNETKAELGVWDPEHLVTRRLVSLEKLKMPAQILIYAHKVAVTSYEDDLMTTIIENPAITETFRVLFEVIWSALENEDTLLRKGILEGTLIPPLQ